ncbi:MULTISPECIES: MFS transporter [Glycomyces]|uniref:GPH family glycoside/pentoside/hexuronide:cation symporter n=2 Tax=Glycomyces TaxID=58113 RepID=A0A9X3PIK9_9ACTN|nr:glycoside-pentoside-hexuronide (GPH):cation symporter [Glycomyces lechevalierae]MDA1386064.1 glycoside-pentoside-hexuronide (GPH):cation symporter [Glycomyces lechevalierae]MDR7340778.1 GPH family glycoside/pentoside/hexuronide:cation symporter [Glycomyces lechevalierae]
MASPQESEAPVAVARAAVGTSLPADGKPLESPPVHVAETPVRMGERLAYSVGDIGGNLIFAAVSSFVLFYFTDTVGIGAAIAGTIILLGRVLDGTMDLVIGTMIDKTRTRWGKARPWVLLSTPVVVLAFIGLFNVPAGLSSTGKEIYAFVFYFLCLAIGYTGSNLAYHTLLSVITSDGKTRVSLTVMRTFAALTATLLVNFFTIPLIARFGGGQDGWTTVVTIYGAVAAITFIVVFLGTKERVTTTVASDHSAARPVRELLLILLKNPYFYLGFALFLTQNLAAGVGGAGIYFARDVLGDAGLYGFFSLAGIGPLLIGMWFMPAITARFGKRLPFLVGSAVAVVGLLIALIDPTDFNVVIAGAVIRAIGTIPVSAALFALIADIVDYGEWKTGVRIDGMTYSAATAGQNLGAGVGAALIGWLLAFAQYDGTAAVQPQTAVDMEVFLYLGVPLIVYVLQFVVVVFLNLDRFQPGMTEDLIARRAGATPAAQD